MSDNLDEVQEQLEGFRTQILEETNKSIGTANKLESDRLIKILENKITSIQEKIEKTQESAQKVVGHIPSINSELVVKIERSILKKKVLEYIKSNESVKFTELIDKFAPSNAYTIIIVLRELENAKLIKSSINSDEPFVIRYEINKV